MFLDRARIRRYAVRKYLPFGLARISTDTAIAAEEALTSKANAAFSSILADVEDIEGS